MHKNVVVLAALSNGEITRNGLEFTCLAAARHDDEPRRMLAELAMNKTFV